MAEQKTEQSSKILNVKPVDYKQTDPKWKSKPYRVKGENSTIGGSGCGPTSAADILATIVDKNITPVETCKWSVDHGYKALNQGSYWGYVCAQFKYYDIPCEQLNKTRLNKEPNNEVHKIAKDLVNQGYYLMILFGPDFFTKSGHWVTCWAWHDGIVYINDPASTKLTRNEADENIVKRDARIYWAIDAREFNRKYGKIIEEDEDMTLDKFSELMDAYLEKQSKEKASKWAEQDIKEAVEEGILAKNERAKSYSTREESLAFTMRAYRKLKEMIEKKK